MVFMFYRVYHISYKKEVPIMDADMKSFLYFRVNLSSAKDFTFSSLYSIPPIITLNPRFMSIIWAKISHKVQK